MRVKRQLGALRTLPLPLLKDALGQKQWPKAGRWPQAWGLLSPLKLVQAFQPAPGQKPGLQKK
jgi:hypothetical protein